MIKWQVLNIFAPGGDVCLHHHAAVRHTVRAGKGVDWSFPFRWVVSPTFRVLLPLSLPMMSLLSIHLENPIVKYLFNAYKSIKQCNIFILDFFSAPKCRQQGGTDRIHRLAAFCHNKGKKL